MSIFESIPITRRQATGAAVLGAIAVALPGAVSAAEPSDTIKALFAAHNKAFTAHDMKGVLATFTPKATMMGTAPGELWVGTTEITEAYKHMFADFEKGKQAFENLWHEARVIGDVAWMMAITKVTLTNKGKKKEFGMNVSLVCEKAGEKWLINTMHFSHLTPGAKA